MIVFIKLASNLCGSTLIDFVNSVDNIFHVKNLTILTILQNVKRLILAGFQVCLVLLNS